ncbi:hypothetical protein HQ520_07690 [bacterium]|nr:hypothetical protein [bacterium]
MLIRDNSSRRGFYLIGLLIVLAIIAILTYKQLAPEEKANQVNMATMSINRSKNTACNVNRNLVQNQISMWEINHLGEKPTLDKLQQGTSSVPSCPEGGQYTIGADGRTVYCSIHNPPPDEPSQNLP